MLHLFRDEHTEVPVLAVDLIADRHEAQQVADERQTPRNQLPVTKVIEEAFAVMQQLQQTITALLQHRREIHVQATP